jgi:hypothetical protein
MSDFNFAIPGLMELQSPESDRLRSYIRLAPHFIQNTNWPGIPSIEPGDTPPSLNLASARMVFGRSSPVIDPLFTLSTVPADDEGLVTIDNATTWRLHVPSQPLPLPVGNYHWEVHATDSVGDAHVFHVGSQMVTA